MNCASPKTPKHWLEIAEKLAEQFAQSAAIRDKQGGTPKGERDLIRTSGLLALSIPQQYGGIGASLSTIFDSIRVLAQADSALAHVYGFHHLLIYTVQLFAQPEQYAAWLTHSAAHNQFWGNALNPLDYRNKAIAQTQGYIFDGAKSFSSGATDSDRLLCSAHDPEGRLLIALLPSDRTGIEYLGDWDNMGQRQTDSGTTLFNKVEVSQQELLLNPGPLSTPFSSLRPLMAQLIFVQVFLGVAEGAFHYAQQQLQGQKAWFKANSPLATQDPYVQQHMAGFWVKLQSTRLLSQHAVDAFDAAWSQGTALNTAQRGEVAVAIATAKIAATEASLNICQGVFQVLGARATTAQLNLDRFWRNVRTQTLHDPVDYKYQELGDWLLNGQYPTPSFYG